MEYSESSFGPCFKDACCKGAHDSGSMCSCVLPWPLNAAESEAGVYAYPCSSIYSHQHKTAVEHIGWHTMKGLHMCILM